MKTKKETKELSYENFLDEIAPIIQKYELKNAVFAAEKEDMFCGSFALDTHGKGFTIVQLSLCLGNAGRLFQSCREKILLLKTF